MPAPRVTVVVPAYRSAAYLPLTLGSLAAQDEFPLDVVVVDDGSPDDSGTVARGFRDRLPGLTVVRQENAGVAAARNAGMRLARTPYVCFLDGDDALAPGMLRALADHLDAHPEVVVAHGDVVEFETDADGAIVELGTRSAAGAPTEQRLLHGQCPLVPSSALVRRAAAEAVGGFDGSFDVSEDFDFFVRLVLAGGSCARVPAARCLYRQVPGQRSANHRAMRRDMLRTLREALRALGQGDPRRAALRERVRFLGVVHAAELDREGDRPAARRALLRTLAFPPRPGHVVEALRLLRRPGRALGWIEAGERRRQAAAEA